MVHRYMGFLVPFFTAYAILLASPPLQAQTAAYETASLLEINQVIPNFGIVSPALFRGGQPGKGGLEALKNAGVKTIVNFRDGEEDIRTEKALAHKLGLKFVSIPLSVFKSVNKNQVDHFLSVVRNPENQPVFAHCRQGQDRCGTMVAMYRMNEEAWGAGQAYNEMLKYGFHPMFIGLTSAVYRMSSDLGRPEAPPSPGEIVEDIKSRLKKALSAL